jgi:hypothetical protein
MLAGTPFRLKKGGKRTAPRTPHTPYGFAASLQRVFTGAFLGRRGLLCFIPFLGQHVT